MKKHKFQTGGDVEEKKRKGLAASAGEKVGFFERMRMGNIDDPSSEAYRRFGAGRGAMPAPDTTPYSETADARNLKMAAARETARERAKADTDVSGAERAKGTQRVDVAKSAADKAVESKKVEPQNFSQAFDAARRAGKPTFPFRGKIYTTELKKDKPKAEPPKPPKAEPPKAEPPKAEPPKAEPPKAPSSTARAAQPAARPTGTPGDPYGKIARIMERVRNPDNPRIRREREELERAKGYKKGGVVKSSASKRADGCAIRGKTRGKMV